MLYTSWCIWVVDNCINQNVLLFGVGGSFTSRIGLLFILFLQIGLCVLSVLCDVGMKNMCCFFFDTKVCVEYRSEDRAMRTKVRKQ